MLQDDVNNDDIRTNALQCVCFNGQNNPDLVTRSLCPLGQRHLKTWLTTYFHHTQRSKQNSILNELLHYRINQSYSEQCTLRY